MPELPELEVVREVLLRRVVDQHIAEVQVVPPGGAIVVRDLTLEQFRALLKPFRGEVKGVLTRNDAIAGIGNAYADEILWAAKLHPYRKRTSLSDEEIARLYEAIQSTLREAIAKVRIEMGENIHLKPCDFMAVHMQNNQPCPRCGTLISQVSANQRITNFCRTCQPGGLIKN